MLLSNKLTLGLGCQFAEAIAGRLILVNAGHQSVIPDKSPIRAAVLILTPPMPV